MINSGTPYLLNIEATELERCGRSSDHLESNVVHQVAPADLKFERAEVAGVKAHTFYVEAGLLERQTNNCYLQTHS